MIFPKCRALHYSTLNCPVICFHLHMAFPTQLPHIPVTPFSTSQVLLSPTHISWIVLCSFPKFWFIFQKLSSYHPSRKPLQPLSPSEWGSFPVCILTICPTLISHVHSSKGIHGLLNSTEVISTRKGTEFLAFNLEFSDDYSKPGVAPEQVVVVKAGFWGPGAQVQRASSAVSLHFPIH